MRLTDADVARIATAVADELARRQDVAAEIAQRRVGETRAADAARKAAERQQAAVAAYVDVQRHVFVASATGEFVKTDFGEAVPVDPNTGACLAETLAIEGQHFAHVADRTGQNADGTSYHVRCYRQAA